jgi:hypothetical protein
MRKIELRKAVQAAAEIAGDSEFIIIGSQAFHGHSTKAPAEVLLSQECDLFPKNRPETANLLQSKLGRGTSFARKNGFFVDVVTPELATLPNGWERRLKPLRFGRATAHCLGLADLVISKIAAGRIKDREFVAAILKLKIVNLKDLDRRLNDLPSGVAREPIENELQLIRREVA